MSGQPDFERDGRDWPHRAASRFVSAGGLRWHVQVMGRGPAVLLLHGTGAASHSFAGLMPLLASDFTVVVPDLPGHGFTEAASSRQLSLPAIGKALARLLETLGTRPDLAIGHSAGAAILIRMTLDRLIAPRAIISLNGALVPTRGMPGPLSSTIARLLFTNPVAPWLFARRAHDPKVIERMMRSTGSAMRTDAMELYARLAQRSGHVAAALGMMANWDLKALGRDLPGLPVPLHLVVGTNDRMVPPSQAKRVQRLLPGASILPLAGLGHLAHEERPEEIREIVERLMEKDVTRTSS